MLINRVPTIRQTIAQAAQESGRHPEDILLLAASKAQPVAALLEAYQAGVRDFGENYLQEALAKQQAMTELAVKWHFIGHVQSEILAHNRNADQCDIRFFLKHAITFIH